MNGNNFLLRTNNFLVNTKLFFRVGNESRQVFTTVHVARSFNIDAVFVLLVLERSVSVTPTLLVEVVNLDLSVRSEVNELSISVFTISDSFGANLSSLGELVVQRLKSVVYHRNFCLRVLD